jgi:MFS family permease
MTYAGSFGAFMALRFAEGCAHIAALSIVLSLASSAAAPSRRGRAMGMTGAGILLGVAAGAPLGGRLGDADPLLPLRVAAGLGVAAAVLGAVLTREGGEGERRPGLAEMLTTLRAHGALAVPLAFAFVDRFTVGFFTSTFVFYLRTIHEVTPARIGLLIATFMLPFALLSFPFGWLSERYSRSLLLCAGSVVYGLGLASLGWWSAPWLAAGMFGLGVAAAVMFVPSLLMTTDLAPDAIRSTALGAFNAAGSLGFIFGPLVGGGVSEQVAAEAGWLAGYRAAFAVGGVSVLLCVGATLPRLLRLVRAGRTT